MKSLILRRIRNLDYSLLVAILLLAGFGLMMIYSSSSTLAYLSYGSSNYFFIKQIQWLFLGLFFIVIMVLIPYRVYDKLSAIFVVLSLVLLVLVLIPGFGVERNNSQRWIQVGSFLFQPTEFIKLFMLIYFASFYSRKQQIINQFKNGVLPALVILAIVFLLTLRQPDLGSATLILIGCGIIVICSGVRFRQLFLLGSVGIIGIGYFAFSSPYRLERLTSFMSPFNDSMGDGYQLINSYVAIGTGGLLGNGLGGSIQKLGFLPEAHTDFIMAIVLEELGIFGLTFVIGIYIFIMFRGIHIARESKRMFPKLLVMGITFQIMTQVTFNLGAVSGLLPITGVPLPLISYGGSSALITMVSFGILLHISTKNKDYKEFGSH